MRESGLLEDMKKYVPNLFLLINSVPNWPKIEEDMETERQRRLNVISKNPDFSFPRLDYNFYDKIFAANQGDLSCLMLLHYYNILCGELVNKLPSELQYCLNDTIIKIFSTMKSDYLHYIGELAVLDAILSDDLYQLIAVEQEITNGVKPDFCLMEKSSGEIKYVEVVNPEIATGQKAVVDLRSKLNKKLNRTVTGTKDIDVTVVPVLWAENYKLEELEGYKSKWERFTIDRVLEPYVFYPYKEGNDKLSYRFTGLSKMFPSSETTN